MRMIVRLVQRIAVLGVGALSLWLIAYVFELTDHRTPTIVALALSYGLGAYLILPRAVRLGLKILQRQHVPRFSITSDGLPGDPINVALVGPLAELRMAFAKAGWFEAEPLTIRTSWRMARAFVLDRPYPTAPFSTLYLYGRGQDVGFQKAIGSSPRKRHHVRFWAQEVESAADAHDAGPEAVRPKDCELGLWVGAATRDTGFSLTRLTFQITHSTDADTNAEREFLIAELSRCGVIRHPMLIKAGDRLGRVNHYIADGDIAVAELACGT